MLKTTTLLCCLAAFATTNGLFIRSYDSKNDQPSNDWAMEQIRNHGYPVEYYSVQTSDGYILDLFRIPSGQREQGVQQGRPSPSDYTRSQSSENENDFLMTPRHQESYNDVDVQNQKQWRSGRHGHTGRQGGSQSNQDSDQWNSNRNDQNQDWNSNRNNQDQWNSNRDDQRNSERDNQNQDQWNSNTDGQNQDQRNSNRDDQTQDQWNSNSRKGDRNQWYSGRDNQDQWNSNSDDQSQNQWSSNRNLYQNRMGSNNKPAVMLVHGLLCSADSFIIGGPSQGLAYVLADNGYDVYLANTRGSKYGVRHTSLDHRTDAAFWRFSSDEIGVKDLPAIVDTIVRVSGQEKIYAVGHSQGNTPLYIMASELPQYNDKIITLVSLNPVAYMGHSTHPMLKYINQHSYSKGWVIKNVGPNSFRPSEELLNNGGKAECQQTATDKMLCDNLYFLLNGYKSQNFNKTLLQKAVDAHYGSASSRQVMHFAQLAKTGTFVRYQPQEADSQQRYSNEGEYDLQKISAPVYLFYAPQDNWSNPEDVEKLAKRLPKANKIEVDNLDIGLDFLYANNVRQKVYERVVDVIRRN